MIPEDEIVDEADDLDHSGISEEVEEQDNSNEQEVNMAADDQDETGQS